MKHLSIILAFLIIGFIQTVNAASPTTTPSATPTGEKNQKIEDLKDRLATKVAELRTTERRAIYGTVKSTSISTITVETATKDVKIELTDDIKVFQMLKGKRTELKIENVEKGDVVTVFGQYDTAVEILKATVIFIQNGTEPQRIFGTITESKKSDYTITVETANGKSFIVDFETTTKTSAWSQDKGIEKAGFSKLLVGDAVTILGTPVAKKDNRLSAIRILDLGNVSGEKPAATPTPTEKSEATASSSKATATPTKSPTPTKKP